MSTRESIINEKPSLLRVAAKVGTKAVAIAFIAGGAFVGAGEAHKEQNPPAKQHVEVVPRPFETPQKFAAKQAEAYVYGLNKKSGDNLVPMRSLNGEIRFNDTGNSAKPALDMFPIILSPSLSTGNDEPTTSSLEHAWVGVFAYDKNGDVTLTPHEFSTEKGMSYVSYDAIKPVLEFEAVKEIQDGIPRVVATDPAMRALRAPDGTPMLPGLFIAK